MHRLNLQHHHKRHHLSIASPTPTSSLHRITIININIYNNKTFSTADLFTSTPAQDIPTCFPRRDTIALFCLSTIPLASESPVSPFYDTQHLFTSKRRITFPVSGFFFPLSVGSFVLAIVFTGPFLLGGTFAGRGRYISGKGKKRFRISGGF